MKKNFKIKEELRSMFEKDQKAIENKEDFYQITVDNKIKLNKIISEIGWPSREKVDQKGETTAWLIVQHSDFDVNFQEKCLNLIRNLPKTMERKQDIAYLTDRIRINKKRKQVYGTQFYMGKNNGMEPYPIIDMKNIDKRRKDLELESFNEYKLKMENLK